MRTAFSANLDAWDGNNAEDMKLNKVKRFSVVVLDVLVHVFPSGSASKWRYHKEGAITRFTCKLDGIMRVRIDRRPGSNLW